MLDFTCKKITAMHLSTTKKNLETIHTCEGKTMQINDMLNFTWKRNLLCVYLQWKVLLNAAYWYFWNGKYWLILVHTGYWNFWICNKKGWLKKIEQRFGRISQTSLHHDYTGGYPVRLTSHTWLEGLCCRTYVLGVEPPLCERKHACYQMYS